MLKDSHVNVVVCNSFKSLLKHKLSGQVIHENLLDFTNLDLETRTKNFDSF